MKNKIKSSNRLKMIFLSLFTLFGTFFMSAQTKTISGKVNGDGLPLPGVQITVKGKAAGTLTDFDGLYNVEAQKGDVLVFTYTGFETQNITIGESNTVNVDLKVEVNSLEEVVVVGYQKQKKLEVTGAVAQVKSEDIQDFAVANVEEALQGQVAGVNIQASSGAPGAKINVQIRGANTLASSSNDVTDPNAALDNPLEDGLSPLWVVDGLPITGDPGLSPSEIETIDIAKDAATASIYGIRAAAGVILVTTKKGKKGKMKIDFNTYTSINKVTRTINTLNASENALLNALIVTRARGLEGVDLNGTRIATNRNIFRFDTDLQDLVLNDNALSRNYNLRVSGASDDMNYSLNVDHLNQDGVIINSNLSRTNVRLNTRVKRGKFSFVNNIFLQDQKQKLPAWRIYLRTLTAAAYTPDPADVERTIFADFNDPNAVTASNVGQEFSRDGRRRQSMFRYNTTLQYDVSKSLKARLSLGVNRTFTQDQFFRPRFDIIDETTGETASNRLAQAVAIYQSRQGNIRTENVKFLLDYNKKIGKHKITGLAGVEADNRQFDTETVQAFQFDNSSGIPSADAAKNKEDNVVSGNARENNLRSALARLSYNYAGKYLVSGNIRRDQSSNFLPGNQKETFGGVSVGWTLSKEKFFKNADFLNFIKNMKFRASIGWVGNQSIPTFVTNQGLATNTGYVSGANFEQVANGLSVTQLSNPNITWESTVNENVGVDLALFKGALTFNADIYRTKKEDLLFNTNLALSAGYNAVDSRTSAVFTNVGEMTNKGIELALGYRDNKGKFKWNISGTFTQNRNEITALAGGNSQINGGRPTPGQGTLGNSAVSFGRVGFPVASFFLLKSDGVISNQQELDEYRTLGGQIPQEAVIGDRRYVDVNGDGSISLDQDRAYFGNAFPDFEAGLKLGFRTGAFDFNMQWFSSFGSKIFNAPRAVAFAGRNHRESLFTFRNGANTEVENLPAYNFAFGQEPNYLAQTDAYLEDGDYIRLRNVTLGFTFPKQFIEKLKINKLRVYLAGSNILTITDYTGLDPEVGGNGLFSRGIDRGNTPVTASGRVGVQLSF